MIKFKFDGSNQFLCLKVYAICPSVKNRTFYSKTTTWTLVKTFYALRIIRGDLRLVDWPNVGIPLK